MRHINGRSPMLLLLIPVAAMGVLIVSAHGVSQVAAQQPEQPGTWITEVDCNGLPELIVITNTSSEPQNLQSWKLESDPPSQESLDLTALAIIWPTQSIMIESGPQAEAAFTWSQKQVLRDNDPTDYVRIVDKDGVVRQEVACTGPVTATPTPSATVLAATAAPSPGGVVPDGGGRPEQPSLDVISPTIAIAAGSAMVGAGILLFAVVWFSGRLRRRRIPAAEIEERSASAPLYVPETAAEPEMTVEPQPTVMPDPAAIKRGNDTQRAVLMALIIILVTMALAVLVLQPRENKRR